MPTKNLQAKEISIHDAIEYLNKIKDANSQHIIYVVHDPTDPNKIIALNVSEI